MAFVPVRVVGSLESTRADFGQESGSLLDWSPVNFRVGPDIDFLTMLYVSRQKLDWSAMNVKSGHT